MKHLAWSMIHHWCSLLRRLLVASSALVVPQEGADPFLDVMMFCLEKAGRNVGPDECEVGEKLIETRSLWSSLNIVFPGWFL